MPDSYLPDLIKGTTTITDHINTVTALLLFNVVKRDIHVYNFIFHSCSKYWQILFLHVSSEYGRQGIGRKLVEFSVQLSEEAGHSVVMGNFASTYSIKIAYSCGFEAAVETVYAEKYKLYNKMDQDIRDKHPLCVIMLKHMAKKTSSHK